MGNSSSSHGKSRHYVNGGSSYGQQSSASGRRASGLPSEPGKPYLVVAPLVDEPDVITVKWKHPAHDGGSKITGYIVEHRRTISPHWLKATPGKVQHNQLTLSGLEPGWRYQFRVKAVNSYGHSSPSAVSDPVTITAHRTAIVAPVFVHGIEDRVALENDQVKFEVEFEGTPVPKISWYKDGFELFSNRRQRVNTDNGISTLYIHQAEYSDEGEIKCSATNKAGHAITKARLRLEAPPMVRLPQDYEEGLLLEQNEPMRLKVSVTGRPLPLVTWLHDGEEIRGDDRFEFIHTDKYAALKLACVKRSDRGCYQIQAVNPLGEHMASFLVTVTDRPSPPGKVHVSKTSGKSVALSWKPPEDDGGCKIGNYIIEYNRVGWDMWLKASTSRQLMANLDDLLEGSEYRFRVKAENPYGISLPSEVSDSIFLPDIKRGIYKPVITSSLLNEDEEKLVKIQETQILEYFGRKSKSPEPSSKLRKLSVDEVSPPIPKRRKKKKKSEINNVKTDIYKSLSFLDVSDETWQQPIEQKDHWGLSPGLKVNSGIISSEDLSSSQMLLLDSKKKRNSTDSLSLINFERGSAPPISLSSPELGAESEEFEEQIRNSYSSSELLYERNLNRFNGYSNDENLSSEAQKIAIYAMDRKNSLRRSPISGRSYDGSEEKSVFSDSDSINSVVEVIKKPNSSSFMSVANSIEEEIIDDIIDETNFFHDDVVPSTSFTVTEPLVKKQTVDEEKYGSDSSDETFIKFGSGKRALEQNTSSAFFSTVYYDDDYLSDQRLSDRERSTSPAKQQDNNDALSQDSLNSVSISSNDYSQLDKDNEDNHYKDENDKYDEDKEKDNGNEELYNISGRSLERKIDSAEICTVDLVDKYRARDGIPKYVMLPNPFYKENTIADRLDKVKFKLSSNSDEIIPPEIPIRLENVENHMSIPVITVTEMKDHSPTSFLKKIFVPSLSGENESYYKTYSNVNSSTFNILRKSPEHDISDKEDQAILPDVTKQQQQLEDTETVVVKHYGDIAEAYSGVGKKSSTKTYLDFEQLKMAAVEDELPVLVGDEQLTGEEYEDEFEVCEEEEEEEEEKEQEEECVHDSLSPIAFEKEIQLENYNPIPFDGQLQTIMEVPIPPNTIPYLKIFGNLSLALFGYWLYMCKDERMSVPIFGFLFFRFFKTQVWDRIE